MSPPGGRSDQAEDEDESERFAMRRRGSHGGLLVGRRFDRSIAVGRDDLAERPGAEGGEGDDVGRVLEEVDRAVGEEGVDAAGVLAGQLLAELGRGAGR